MLCQRGASCKLTGGKPKGAIPHAMTILLSYICLFCDIIADLPSRQVCMVAASGVLESGLVPTLGGQTGQSCHCLAAATPAPSACCGLVIQKTPQLIWWCASLHGRCKSPKNTRRFRSQHQQPEADNGQPVQNLYSGSDLARMQQARTQALTVHPIQGQTL